MAKFKCPCCGNYPFIDEDDAFFNLCPICQYWYDPVCVENPDTVKGPNKITLSQARINYLSFGVCDVKKKKWARRPYEYELPKSNE